MKKIIAITLCLLLTTISAFAKTIYVALDGSHTTPFDTWAKAATNVQDALNISISNDLVLVNDGTYTKTNISKIVTDSGVIWNTYYNISNEYVTLKSVNGPSVTTLFAKDQPNALGKSVIGVANNCILDGFTIDKPVYEDAVMLKSNSTNFNNISVYNCNFINANGGTNTVFYASQFCGYNNTFSNCQFYNQKYAVLRFRGDGKHENRKNYIIDCIFSNNIIVGQYPVLWTEGNIEIKNTKFYNNQSKHAANYYGLFYLSQNYWGSIPSKNTNESIIVDNCQFIGNVSTGDTTYVGTYSTFGILVMYNLGINSEIQLKNTIFSNNTYYGHENIVNLQISAYVSNCIVENCKFQNNLGTNLVAIHPWSANLITIFQQENQITSPYRGMNRIKFQNNIISDNIAYNRDAVSLREPYIYNTNTILVKNCLFNNNKLRPIDINTCNVYHQYVVIENCTFINNISPACIIYETNCGTGRSIQYIKNCIFFGNNTNDFGTATPLSSVYLDYSSYNTNNNYNTNFYKFSSRDGNITNVNPQFVSPETGDFHLRSRASTKLNNGSWVGFGVHSPCIDTGDPASDYSNEPMPNGGRINMGYYGNTPEASKSLWGTNTTGRYKYFNGEMKQSIKRLFPNL